MRILLTLGALALAVSAAAATDKAPPAADPEKKICRREEVIGSVIPEHVCMTKAEWDAFDAEMAKKNKLFLEQRGTEHGGMSSAPH